MVSRFHNLETTTRRGSADFLMNVIQFKGLRPCADPPLVPCCRLHWLNIVLKKKSMDMRSSHQIGPYPKVFKNVPKLKASDQKTLHQSDHKVITKWPPESDILHMIDELGTVPISSIPYLWILQVRLILVWCVAILLMSYVLIVPCAGCTFLWVMPLGPIHSARFLWVLFHRPLMIFLF